MLFEQFSAAFFSPDSARSKVHSYALSCTLLIKVEDMEQGFEVFIWTSCQTAKAREKTGDGEIQRASSDKVGFAKVAINCHGNTTR